MPKWDVEECGKIVDDTGAFLGRANSEADAANLCSDHNDDINAIQRKLDDVLRVVKRDDITYGAASEIRAILEATQ